MYCQNCGTPLHEGSRFCAGCGRAVAIAVIPGSDNRVARHVRLLAILWMARAGLKLVAGAAVIIVGRTILPIILGELGGAVFPNFVPALVSATGWGILLLAIPSLAAGIGLFNHETWARPLAIVMGFLSLLSPILGTALGIYTLWVLLPARSEAEYQQLVRAA